MSHTERAILTGILEASSNPIRRIRRFAFATPKAITAKELLGAPVIGAERSEVAVIEDALLSADGHIMQLVVRPSQMPDDAESALHARTIELEAVTLVPRYAQPPRIVTQRAFGDLEEAGTPPGDSSASQSLRLSDLLDRLVAMAETDQTLSLIDAVFDARGRIAGLVMQTRPRDDQDKTFLAPYDALKAATDQAVILDFTDEDIAEAKKYIYDISTIPSR